MAESISSLELEFTLTSKDVNDMYSHVYARHSQRHFHLVEDFHKLFMCISDKLSSFSSSMFYEEMDNSLSTLTSAIVIMKQNGMTEPEIRALTTIVAMSFMITGSSNIENVRKASRAMSAEANYPFVVTEANKMMFKAFVESVFSIWESFDNLAKSTEEDGMIYSAYETAVETFSVSHVNFSMWMLLIMEIGFKATKGTSVNHDGVNVVEAEVSVFTARNPLMLFG